MMPSTAADSLEILAQDLARTYGSDDLVRALVTRLSAEGRVPLAGALMDLWSPDLDDLVDPGYLAAALVVRLRADGRGELADRVESLLKDAAPRGHGSMDGTPESIMVLHPTEAVGSWSLMG